MFKKNDNVNISEQYRKKKINLLPDIYFKRKRRTRLVILIAVLIAVAVAAFVVQIINLNNELDYIRVENEKLINSIKEKEEERQRQTLLTSLKNRIEFKVNLLKDIESENASVIKIAETIEEALPEGVMYVSVDFDSTSEMNIYGRTLVEVEIPDLVHKLREKNIFHEIRIESVTKSLLSHYEGIDEYYEFVLICSFGGDEDASNQ